MTDETGLSLRDMIIGVSSKVDELTRLLHQNIERMISQKEGMERLGSKTDKLEEKIEVKTEALAERIKHVELANAAAAPENRSTGEWVKLIIAMIISAAFGALVAHFTK